MERVPGARNEPNPQLVEATRLVVKVTREIESLLPQARRRGSVRVEEWQIERWERQLERAVGLLEQIPVIMIYPPPPIVGLIRGATEAINAALGILEAIPIASTRIYPPQPGWANVSSRTLRRLLDNLYEALSFLFRALQSS